MSHSLVMSPTTHRITDYDLNAKKAQCIYLEIVRECACLIENGVELNLSVQVNELCKK